MAEPKQLELAVSVRSTPTAGRCLHVAGGAQVALVVSGRALCVGCQPPKWRKPRWPAPYTPEELQEFRRRVAAAFGEDGGARPPSAPENGRESRGFGRADLPNRRQVGRGGGIQA
jgi:hypothetical protein